jgi:hypothetical protein
MARLNYISNNFLDTTVRPAWISSLQALVNIFSWSGKQPVTPMVERIFYELPELTTRVRFPSPAPVMT